MTQKISYISEEYMKNKEYLTVRQEELMNFLWRVNEPMTANEMAEKLETEGWNNVTLFKWELL